MRNMELKRAYDRAYHATHKEKDAAYQVAYSQTHQAERAEYRNRYKMNYPEKRKAQKAVEVELRYNRWPPANMQVCEICGEAQAEEYHHHLGYEPEHWLHAQAVCRECHVKAHKEARIEKVTA